MEKHLIHDGERSYWAVCVSYLEVTSSPPSSAPPATRRGKVDYRDVLDEREFALFTRLRSLRKTLAEQEGIPAYALFTNEQLASMIQQRVASKAALGTIDGVGTARVDKYGEAFLRILLAQPPQHEDTATASPNGATAVQTASPRAEAP
jgi:superfamily II DNA helicase RecQ